MSTASEVSAYVMLISDDNNIVVTQKRRVIQRSKLIDNLWFLVKPEYNGFNMSEFTVLLEYLAPVSRKYRTDILQLEAEDYNGYLKYTMPIDTTITAEAGDVEFQITFIGTGMDAEGNVKQHVRKITGGHINIVPITAWSDIIPDDALSALDQRIIKTDAQIKALNDLGEALYYTKADDISYDEEDNVLQLLAGGVEIGKKITIRSSGESLKDGVPVVDISGSNSSGGSDVDDDIIEF